MQKKMFRRYVTGTLCLGLVMSMAACGGSSSSKPALDLNTLSYEQIVEGAKKEGKLESVGMPGSWANWQDTWDGIESEFGIDHNDTDMSSGEEIAMFEAEKNAPTKDIGDVGHKFGPEAKEKGVTQSFKTSHWDSVPELSLIHI